jgi:hypothetical protein
MVGLPRDMVRAGDPDPIIDRLDDLIEIAPSLTAARESIEYNRRRREPYPEDYELTLARYEVWKAEQLNAAVAARTAQAHADALQVTARIRNDPGYLNGFADGVQRMRSWYEDDCPDLVNIRFSSVSRSPSRADRGHQYKDGFSDGQELTFNLLLADRLGRCYVPVPPLPADAY